jgi:hypothetical protein
MSVCGLVAGTGAVSSGVERLVAEFWGEKRSLIPVYSTGKSDLVV